MRVCSLWKACVCVFGEGGGSQCIQSVPHLTKEWKIKLEVVSCGGNGSQHVLQHLLVSLGLLVTKKYTSESVAFHNKKTFALANRHSMWANLVAQMQAVVELGLPVTANPKLIQIHTLHLLNGRVK